MWIRRVGTVALWAVVAVHGVAADQKFSQAVYGGTVRLFKQILEGRPGFVIAPWCGSAECEAQIKTETQATIRNMPIGGAAPAGRCIRCDAAAKAEAWFAKAY